MHDTGSSSEKYPYDYSSLTGHHEVKSRVSKSAWIWIISFTLSAILGAASGLGIIYKWNRVGFKSNSFVPDVPWKIVSFEPDDRFTSSDPGNPDGSIWDDLDPEGQGWIEIHDWKKWRLPPSPGNGYQIAMYHQLHCLASLKADTIALYSLLDSDLSYETVERVREKVHKKSHSTHCVEYLRQSVMCAGDTTLEPFAGQLGLAGIQHKCRDWDTIFDFATKHKKTNLTGILG